MYVLIASLIVLFTGMLGYMFAQAFGKSIIAEEIVLDSLPLPFDGFRILFITDIHRRRLPSVELSRLKNRVDAVFVGGDITEKNSPLERLADNMALLASIAPVYAVHGNHDYRANTPIVDNILRGNGVRLLVNENEAIERREATLWLTGLDYPKNGGKIAYAPLPPLPFSDTDQPCRIILVHDPLWLSQCATLPADLVLAGHTHGGQIILPLIGRRHIETFYHTYDAGRFKWPKDDGGKSFAQVLISRGFGTSHLPLRWGSPAQMHILTLRRGTTA
ncbi:metallophosphoesterase [Paenibacillus wynnii]|uniref:metallophosphoesterase n=1 Tax=Paenibacillus wynnii TaxID=268407 RepID=UPI00278DA556|nr:metallophosphoesterase [Paenibacillus wynnii]MDQ0193019.1 putative MPP superfamily phosphohydrolase [Paenibacillus wynnii]